MIISEKGGLPILVARINCGDEGDEAFAVPLGVTA